MVVGIGGGSSLEVAKSVAAGSIMGMPTRGTSFVSKAESVVNELSPLVSDLGLDRSLLSFGGEGSGTTDLAMSAMSVERLMANNPRRLSAKHVCEIFTDLM